MVREPDGGAHWSTISHTQIRRTTADLDDPSRSAFMLSMATSSSRSSKRVIGRRVQESCDLLLSEKHAASDWKPEFRRRDEG